MKPTQKKLLDVYHCSTYKLAVTRHITLCTSHHISSEAVNEIILDAIRQTCGYVKEYESLFMEQLRESTAIKQSETAKAHKKQITKNERRLIEIDRIYKSLYEDKALGKIEENIFEQMADGYQQERDELSVKIKTMQLELDAFNEDNTRADKFLEIVQRYTNFETLTPAMLNEFVDKVIVHEGEWSEGNTGINGRPRGVRSQQVDVYLKHIGSFAVPDMRTPEQIEADRIADEELEARRTYYREKTRRSLERKRNQESESNNNPTPAA